MPSFAAAHAAATPCCAAAGSLPHTSLLLSCLSQASCWRFAAPPAGRMRCQMQRCAVGACSLCAARLPSSCRQAPAAPLETRRRAVAPPSPQAWSVPLEPRRTFHGQALKVHKGFYECYRAATIRGPLRERLLQVAGASGGGRLQVYLTGAPLPRRFCSRWCRRCCCARFAGTMLGGRRASSASHSPTSPLLCPAGHSLGGALAALAAFHIKELLGLAVDISFCTFGAPRVSERRTGSRPPRGRQQQQQLCAETLISEFCPPPCAPQVGNAAFTRALRRAAPDCWSVIHDQDPVARVPAGAFAWAPRHSWCLLSSLAALPSAAVAAAGPPPSLPDQQPGHPAPAFLPQASAAPACACCSTAGATSWHGPRTSSAAS